MLKLFDPFENYSIEAEPELSSGFSMLELSETLGIDAEILIDAIDQAIRACTVLNIPVSANFRPAWMGMEGESVKDWEMSPLGCYLTIVNCKSDHPAIATAQLYFAMHQHNY